MIVAVPYDGHRELLESLSAVLEGKVVVDCVNPLGFDKQGAYGLAVEEGSAAQQAAAVLPGARVVGAFHHVSAVLLLDDAVESSRHRRARGGRRPRRDGPRPGARRSHHRHARHLRRTPAQRGQVEAMTANLISMNRRYKSHAGLRVTDV